MDSDRGTRHRRTAPRFLAVAVLCLGPGPPAVGAVPSTGLSVSLLHDEGRPVRLKVHMPASMEPDLGWSGSAQPTPFRLVLAWRGADLTLDRPLPVIPAGGVGPVQVMALHKANGQSRLELQLDQAVQPSLRRVGDDWVLQLDPDDRATPAPAARATPPTLPTNPRPPEAPAPVMVAAYTPAGKPRARSADAKQRPEVLLVDMTVNGQRVSGVVHAERLPGGALLLAENAWTEARLAMPTGQSSPLTDGTPAHSLDAVAGLTYRIDRSTLGLEINAPASAFVGSTLGPEGPVATPPPRPAAGAMLNYDASVARGGNGGPVTTGATLEAVAFGTFGTVVASGLATHDGTRRRFDRLDAYWRYDMPERLETLVVGDTIGVGGGWSRPARYGGVRWGRDFGMRPGFVTMPQFALAGEAALPSTVDVLVNNAKRISQNVAPGPFDLPNVPVATGAGEVNLVVRDLLGRETIVKQSYYASPRLLAPDLTDFSLEAGWLRTGYGQDSDYGDAFAAGTIRRGITPAMTGEARVEIQADRRAAGVELAGLLGSWAVGRMALAASSDRTQGFTEQGQMVQLGIERSTPVGGGALQYEYASRGFARFGESAGASAIGQRPRESWLASVGGPIWGPVSGALSYVRQTRWNGDRVASLGLFLSSPLARGASVGFSVNTRLDDEPAWSAGVNISVPLDNGVFTAARVDRNTDGRMAGNASASLNPPAGPGLGWRVEASTQESQRARGGLLYNTHHGEFAADAVTDAHGKVAVRAGGRGTVGVLAGVPFASRPVGEGSFAVVEIEGIESVPIKRSNQVVAQTDSRGLAFISGLLPWQKNQIEIDAEDMPMDVDLRDTVKEVTPHSRSGTFIRFDIRRTRQALLVLHQADAQPVPVGTQVKLGPGGPEFKAGRRGEVWLTDLAAGRQALRVRWPAGGCDLELDLPQPAQDMPAKIGPLACGGAKQ